MADIFSKEKRSQIMAAVSGKDTKPELRVRRFLFSAGFRYRKNVKTLPGKPDIVLPKYKSIILIHGCFWHGHNCKNGRQPITNKQFWDDKISLNIQRDKNKKRELEGMGWKVYIVWSCDLKNNTVFHKTMIKVVTSIREV